MLLNKYYLKNYLLDLKLINEKNNFFIIENLCKLNLYKFNLKSFFLLKRNNLYYIYYKGRYYYLNFNKKNFLIDLVLLNEFLKIHLFFLNGIIYNNFYLNLNNININDILYKFFNLNLHILFFFINIFLNIYLYIYFFLLKFIILLYRNVKIFRK